MPSAVLPLPLLGQSELTAWPLMPGRRPCHYASQPVAITEPALSHPALLSAPSPPPSPFSTAEHREDRALSSAAADPKSTVTAHGSVQLPLVPDRARDPGRDSAGIATGAVTGELSGKPTARFTGVNHPVQSEHSGPTSMLSG
ncbi:uncharacterized protein LOC133900570 [Phragmites australis]|uniref:uncharacterized protein LOC133900570 n=1 Tax=Phragmites australis TaxID=29695 RepID=UPI002D79D4D8|nr:uncharacterized protein LOC133900570 [Phragmites australis]